jgi:hypothetical protein
MRASARQAGRLAVSRQADGGVRVDRPGVVEVQVGRIDGHATPDPAARRRDRLGGVARDRAGLVDRLPIAAGARSEVLALPLRWPK